MKTTTIIALALAAVVLTGTLLTPISAQSGAPATPGKIAVCDFGQVYNSYEKAKALQKKLDENLALIKKEDDVRGDEVKKIEDELKSNQYKERSAAYEQRFSEFVAKSAEHRTWMEVQKAKSQRWHLMMTTEMFNDIKDGIKAVAEARGIDVVLQTHQMNFESPSVNELFQKAALHKVLYHSDKVDITNDVLARVNDAFRRAGK
ncbi:MAG: OmpH family outer membrane protein [Planctomycetota bacterium]|nr:OmpH family outer membrane protein [Planctomycetota bacterium]